jgi:hypothetical protein
MSLTPVPDEGVFTRRNRQIIDANFAALTNPDFWVRPQAVRSDVAADGSYERPFGSMSAVSAKLVPGVVVGLLGVLNEEYTSPLGVNDVTVVGMANTPRQATTSGVPNGGGATWLSPATVTNSAALIRVQGQGWTLSNIYFNSSATANGCIQPYTTGDPPTAADGAHLLVDGCILTGAAFGVYASGGTNFVTIQNSSLFGFSGSGDIAIAQTAGAGIGTLLGWKVLNCRFWGNASNIVMPFNQGTIRNCIITNGTAANINLTGGTAPNFVQQNVFNIAAADFDPAGGTTGVTGDAWSNYLTDAVETGLPAN